MLSVSKEFKTAILATERRIRAKVEIVLFDNDSLVSGSATTSATSTHTPPAVDTTPFAAANAFDTRSEIGRKVAVSASDVFPSGDLYPVPVDGTAGWWGDVISGVDGVLPSAQTLTITYNTATKVQAVSVAGDSTLGYPVAFTVEVLNSTTSLWETIATVTDNDQAVWSYNLLTPITATQARLTITKISKANRYPVVLEFVNGWVISTEGVLSDRVKNIDLKREAFFEDESTLPVGNYSAAECSIVLDNSDGVFYQRNKNSPYFGYLKPNKKVKVWFGLYVPNDSGLDENSQAVTYTKDASGYVWLPMGTFYTLGFRGGLGSADVTVQCWDRVKRFQEIEYGESFVFENKKISEFFTTLAGAAKLGASEYVIDTTSDVINYAYFEKLPFWTHFKQLAAAETGYVRIDEQNRLVFKDRYFYWSTRVSGTIDIGFGYIPVNYVGGVKAGDTIYVVSVNQKTEVESTDIYTVSSVDDVNNYIYVTPSTVRGYAKDSYVTKALPAASLTGENAITDASDDYSLDKMKNKILIKINPLTFEIDDVGNLVGSKVIWKTEDSLTLASGASKVLDVEFENKPIYANTTDKKSTVSILVSWPEDTANPSRVDPLLADGVTPVMQATWVQNDGAGNKPYAWGGHLEIKNNDTVSRTALQIAIDGYQMERKGKQEITAKDDLLVAEYGEKVYTLDNLYIVKESQATGIAKNLLEAWKDPSAPITIDLPARGLFHLQVGDRVEAQDDQLGLIKKFLNTHFYVVRQNLHFEGSMDGQIDCIPAL